MAVFISYAARDRVQAHSVVDALMRAQEMPWLDENLGGGEAWWGDVLHQIRMCDVFIFALSSDAVESKPCRSQLQYAQALNKPVLPVQIGPLESMRFNPLSAIQVIDYLNPGVANSLSLVAAVHAAQARAAPLPDPLPEAPPLPFAYLNRLTEAISSPMLSSQDQQVLVGELRDALMDDGGDESVRRDIGVLLYKLRDRPEITYRTRMDVESLLGSLDDVHHSKPVYPRDAPVYPTAPPMYPTGPPPAPMSAPPPEGPARPWWRRRR
jgi:hypothetical protein